MPRTCCHVVECPQRMTLVQQLPHVPLVQRPRDYEHHVVDHVAVRAVVEELGQGLVRVGTHVPPVVHKLLRECGPAQPPSNSPRAAAGEAGAREGSPLTCMHRSTTTLVRKGPGSFCRYAP